MGETALTDVERLDDWRLAGTLPAADAPAEVPLGPTDVRVDLGGGFGVLTAALDRTGPVDGGQTDTR